MTWAAILQAAIVGVIATGFMDIVAMVRKRLMGTPSLNYAMVGRWLGHIPRGKLHHDFIAKSAAIEGEFYFGWAAHYLIGIGFAVLFVWLFDPAWLVAPALVPALLFGTSTVVAPFFIMQPSMGAGVAAAKTPRPWTARARSITAHMSFGLGLWVGGLLLNL